MAKPLHQFRKSLDKAQSFTDTTFKQWYPDITLTDGRKGDYIDAAGRLCELKLDFYPKNTGNIFLETHSRYPDKIGGPYQAKLAGCELYVYCFCLRQEVLTFNIDKLLEWCNNHLQEHRAVYIGNVGYSGKGHIVPITALQTIIQTFDTFAPKPSAGLGNPQTELQKLRS